MLLTARPAWIGPLRRIRFWAFALVGLVISHDAVFLAQYGVVDPGELDGTGHDGWVGMAILVLGPALAALLLGLAGLAGLRRRLAAVALVARPGHWERDAGRPADPSPDPHPGYLPELAGLLPRLFLAITLAFVVQENVEHLATGRGLPGLWVLSWPEYPLAIPVLAAVTLVLASLAAWIRWRTAVLLRALAAVLRAAATWGRGPAPAPAFPRPDRARPTGRLLARRLAGRAPPGTGSTAAA